MSDLETSRLAVELELLEAMYPDQTRYDVKSREFKFTADDHRASLLLRLPESYPDRALPDVISASAGGSDVRTQTKVAVQDLALVEGEEALDAIIAAFQQVLEDTESSTNVATSTSHATGDNVVSTSAQSLPDKPRTVIIWLHHLLNTNKRKLALSPTNLSGLTKPGYPGVLVYSGPSQSVTEHVAILKAQNWQAFNVRFEEDEEWVFAHGKGVREVETMAEIAKGVELDNEGKIGGRGSKQKEDFLKAVGIK